MTRKSSECRGQTYTKGSLKYLRDALYMSNVRLWPEGADSARSKSYGIAWHERPDDTTATIYGRYLDRLARTPYGWRTNKRRMDMGGADAGFRVEIPQTARRPPPGWTD